MDNLLQQGIAAVKSGDKVQAFRLLTRATQDSATAEQAWLWLSGVVEVDSERLFCLDNALRINPGNEKAQRAATAFRQKGVFPSTPLPPQPAPASQPSRPEILPQATTMAPALATEANRADASTLYRFVATELASKKLPHVIVKSLTDQGVSPAVATKIVAETEQVFKKARGEKYRKQMIRGLLWTIVGSTITCLTYAFASNLGGQYVLCWGAVLFGIIDFLAGLFGWVSNR